MTIYLQFERQVEKGTIRQVSQDVVHFQTTTATYQAPRQSLKKWRGAWTVASRDCMPL